MLPTAGLMDHETAVLVVLPTVAANCCVFPPHVIETGDGDTETVTGGVRLMVAVPLLVVSAALVAVTVTVWADAMEAGAVYRPAEEIEPAAGLIDQVTAVLEVLPTVAVNCCVLPPLVIETGEGDTKTVTGGLRAMVAVPLLVVSAALVAVTVMVWADAMEELGRASRRERE